MKERWLDQIREKMEAHQKRPPIEIWDELVKSIESSQLDGGDPLNSTVKKSNRSRIGLWAASLVGIGLVSAILIYHNTKWAEQNPEGKIVDSTIENRKDKDDQFIESKDSPVNPFHSDNKSREEAFQILDVQDYLAVRRTASDRKQSQEVQGNKDEFFSFFIRSEEENTSNEILIKNVEYPSVNYRPQILYAKGSTETIHPQKDRRRNKLSIGPLFGQASGGEGFQSPGYFAMNGLALPSVSLLDSPGDFSKVFVFNMDEAVETKVNHKMPLSVGLGVNYGINERLSVSSGVNYTLLSSELNAGTSTNYLKTKQDLHYIGVPLQLNYRISKSDKVSTYGFAGGEIKKVVAGKQQTQYYISNQLSDQTTESGVEKPFQVSLRGGVGVEVPVFKSINFFVEPALEYHIDDRSSLETVYKENPLNLTIKGGLRISIDSRKE